MRVTLDSAIGIRAADLPVRLFGELKRTLRVENPRFVDAALRGRGGFEQPELCFVERVGDEVRLPRGAMHVLRNLAGTQGVPLEFEDRRESGESAVFAHSRALRDYQARAVAMLLDRQQAIAIAPAGAGKTTMAVGAIARAGRAALVLVDKVDLLNQWRDEVRAQLGIEAGIVGAGQQDVRVVTVGIVQTLAQMTPPELAQLMQRFGTLVCDEVHHAASPTWSRVINASPARYRWGFTATERRQDSLTPALEWIVGPFVEIVQHAELLTAGALVAPHIWELATNFSFDYRCARDWPALLDALVSDTKRNALIVNRVATDARAGHLALVLTGRVSHAEQLASELVARGVTAAALTGQTPKKLRTQTLALARAGELSVLLATQLADEGLDLPRLSRVYLAFPARAAGRIEQRIGRVMRPHPDKKHPAVIDVVDRRVGVLWHQSRERARVFADVLGARTAEAVGA